MYITLLPASLMACVRLLCAAQYIYPPPSDASNRLKFRSVTLEYQILWTKYIQSWTQNIWGCSLLLDTNKNETQEAFCEIYCVSTGVGSTLNIEGNKLAFFQLWGESDVVSFTNIGETKLHVSYFGGGVIPCLLR